MKIISSVQIVLYKYISFSCYCACCHSYKMSRFNDIKLAVISDLLKKKVFGDEIECVGCEFDSSTEDLRNTDMVFFSLNLRKGNESLIKKLVVKFEPKDANVRRVMLTTPQYFNELYAYLEIFPLVNDGKIEPAYPEFVVGSNAPELSYVVMEDLKESGYRMCKDLLYTDVDHVKLSLVELGRFHALSYAAKEEKPAEFFRAVSKFKEAHYGENERVYHSVRVAFDRVVTRLPSKYSDQVERFVKLIESKNRFFLEIVKPEEPMCVVCHGDFYLQNMMYRYSEGGRPIGVKFIDYAMMRYASPVIDLSFFLFMNFSPKDRDRHLDELLEVYHDSLSSTFPHVTVPSLDDVKEEFRRKCIYGFLHTVYFLPVISAVVTGDCPLDFQNMCDGVLAEKLNEILRTVGGDKAAEEVTEVVEDFFDHFPIG
uniref:CHK kinase-like domain-containing protein n=1 Tax=Clastoptera arizonana TaxID=38151 RepID=A0A1B6EB40_9HEMI